MGDSTVLPGTGPLLATKFHIPRRRPGLVPRARLVERLERGTQSRLTLISAPPGFGKTTLLADWIAAHREDGRSVAWLSLDRGDNEPGTFWAYVVGALQAALPAIGRGVIPRLQSAQPAEVEPLLALVLNDMAELPGDLVLVLDDYHVIERGTIHEGVAHLIERLPVQVHLVIASRADPVLPLARMRARGELVEIRAADLRFTAEETAAFLNSAMGLKLAVRDVLALESRTEGWIAALQLAALSMQGHDDIVGFISAFTGNDRYIVDYLVEEVLQRQPDEVRSFLLATCVLDRLTGPLCDAVTCRDDGKAMLEALDRRNLFLVPLDDRRRWYRYHHLFADVLQAHVADADPGRALELHRRASAWYERNGDRAAAIHHALAGEDFAEAVGLIELAMPGLRASRQEGRLVTWLRALPEDVLRHRPVLNIGYAGALLQVGEVDGVEARLLDTERSLAAASEAATQPGGEPAALIAMDERELARVAGWIPLYRAVLAQVEGDGIAAVQDFRRALELAAEDDYLLRGAAAALVGLATWAGGDLEEAYRSYAAGMAHLRSAGHIADVVGGSITLADIRLAQGRLRAATRIYDEGLRISVEHGPPLLRGTADMHVGLADLLYERGDLEAAGRQLQTSIDLGEHTCFPRHAYRWRVSMARIQEAQGDLAGALALIEEAEPRYVSDFSPNVRPIAAVKARVWLAQGRLGEALAWAAEQNVSVEDELRYLREFDHITLARLLVARSRSERQARPLAEAAALLERLLRAAEDGKRAGSVIEIVILRAVVQQAQGELPAALASLERALELAEPEGYVRMFVDEGPPMRDLLRRATASGIGGAYARRLLAAFAAPGPSLAATRTAVPGLAEPLTARELEILRLVAGGLQNQAIADHLVLSVATVKRHIANLYSKLGVGHRTEAVVRATELGLL